MKKISTLVVVLLCTVMSMAQHSVTLTVIDNENGTLTNKVDDQNEINVFCWAGTAAGTQIYDGDWWYPMYQDTGRPGGLLIKDAQNGTWTWQVTFDNLAADDYKWNPHMKTLGWASIHGVHPYTGGPDLYFTIHPDGSVTGDITLELPLVPTNINDQKGDGIKVYSKHRSICIEKPANEMNINIYNISGGLIKQLVSSESEETIAINNNGLYIVQIGNQSFKVVIN